MHYLAGYYSFIFLIVIVVVSLPELDAILLAASPFLTYMACALVVGIESIGVPLPGELVLITATLLAARPGSELDPVMIAMSAAGGAIVGDSIGYTIGRRYGYRLLNRLGHRFPRHLGPSQVATAQRLFHRYGAWAVLGGRFVALLRILAGPLAGAMHMRYPVFFAANATGGALWASATSAAVYTLGVVAETWLTRFAWGGLLLALIGGWSMSRILRRRFSFGADENAASKTADT
ncbi:DedA family protein [Pseudonocardia sp. ICBG601]|uniref:DedA family protein n=1 Tax=Pseudonocardia sp. ICBG601 TaxID=2846759 RepID=UPI001CF6722B|nr:DedA family protein [Pseudonocardia sp. ICBG601]